MLRNQEDEPLIEVSTSNDKLTKWTLSYLVFSFDTNSLYFAILIRELEETVNSNAIVKSRV